MFLRNENTLLNDDSSGKDLDKKFERSTTSEDEAPTTALTNMDVAPRRVTFDLTEQVFPTEAAIRAKGTWKAKEAVGKAQGKTLKEMRKRKPQQEEGHFDDFGSDTGPIEEKASWLALPLGTSDEVSAHCFFDSEPEPVGWDLALDTNQEFNYVLCDSYYQTYHLLGY